MSKEIMYIPYLVFFSFIGSIIGSTVYARDDFPKTFGFGVATAAYQIEGAWDEDGKGESMWDYQTHTFPGRIHDNSTGDIACDSYHKIELDVANLKQLRVKYYRFSLSWPRILPRGYANYVNEAGVNYYNKLIDTLLRNDIEPVVTIYHWDMPQIFIEQGGWTNKLIVDYYAAFAEVCFKRFGDRVKRWITINEPMQICGFGYGRGELAPFYTQDGIAPYLCGHNLLLGHAEAYHMYNKYFRASQNGMIGFTAEAGWYEPLTNSRKDKDAAERAMQMYFGWFMHPIFSKDGDYPAVMKKRIDEISRQQGFDKSRLPKFSKQNVNDIQGSADFLGLNHYETAYAENCKTVNNTFPNYSGDVCVLYYRDPKWESTARSEFKVVPWGFYKLLLWIKNSYNNPEVLITENGYAGYANESVQDLRRANYINKYLAEVSKAIYKNGCNIIGYIHWAFMDNFEWADGYTMRFGLYHVDFDDINRNRTPKTSAYVFQRIAVTRKINDSEIPTSFLNESTYI